jgi:hypothetical protein
MILFLLKFFNFCWGRPFEVLNPDARNPTYASATTEVAPSHQTCDMTVNDKSEGTWLLQRISSFETTEKTHDKSDQDSGCRAKTWSM